MQTPTGTCLGCGELTLVLRADGAYEPCSRCGFALEGVINPDVGFGPDPEPPTPPVVADIRGRWGELEAEARRTRDRVLETVAEKRWADPCPSPEPLGVERLWGRRWRWLNREPARSDSAGRVGLDAHGRLVALGDRVVYDHRPEHITGYALTEDLGLQFLERWTLEDGRFVDKVEVEDGPSWMVARYVHDERGRLVVIGEEFWSVGEHVQAMHGQMRTEVRYDEAGEVDEIVRHRVHDGSTTIDYRAKPISARRQREALIETLREGLLTTLRELDYGGEVRAVCLLYDTWGTDPPTVIVDRSDRFDRDPAELGLDDVSPLEWRVAASDHVRLAGRLTWSATGVLDAEDGPRVLHKIVRAVVNDLSGNLLTGTLGAEKPPLLFAMDTEQEHARTHLRDAFGTAATRVILASGHL